LPLFSVITITFNNRDGLRKTADSIQSQTHSDIEWIIIDGHSMDGTQDDFINYSSAKIISEPDKGIYDAMNKGIERATGDYIIFMNAGDLFANENILNDVSKFCTDAPDFIYGDAIEDDYLKRARPHSKISWGMFTHHQAMFYNRLSLADMRYDQRYKIAADYDLTLRFWKRAKHVVYATIPVCIFETGGVSQTNADTGRNEQFISRQRNKSCSTLQNHFIRLLQIIAWNIRKNNSRLYWRLKGELEKTK
jgi:putative colanic acid biosynthesis glycosyltransferase